MTKPELMSMRWLWRQVGVKKPMNGYKADKTVYTATVTVTITKRIP